MSVNVSLTLGCQAAQRQSYWIEGSLPCPSEMSLSEVYMSNLWSKNIAVICAASPQPPPGSTSGENDSRVCQLIWYCCPVLEKHFDILTFIWISKMKNYQSRSFVSQSRCWWPRCSSPADWDKRPGCPEPSDCVCDLEYPLVPGGLNKIQKAQWKQNKTSLYLDLYEAVELLSLSKWSTHTWLSPDSDSWLHSRCQLLKTPWSNHHLSSHHSCGGETALSLLEHKPPKIHWKWTLTILTNWFNEQTLL